MFIWCCWFEVIYNIVPFRTPYPKIVPQSYMHASAQVTYQCYMLESARGTYRALHYLFECMSFVASVVVFTVMRALPCYFYMVRIAQHHHDVLIFVLVCDGRSNFVGGVPFSHVLSQFLIERQFRDGRFFASIQALCARLFSNWRMIAQAVYRSYWAFGLFHSRSTKLGASPRPIKSFLKI